jgi:protein SCO1/2
MALAACLLAAAPMTAADKEYPVSGLVLKVDPSARTLVVSHDRIPGLMDAMAMPFEVRDASELKGIVAGDSVEFTLQIGEKAGYATRIRVRRYQSLEPDPATARRLALMKRLTGDTPPALAVGTRVPDFTLIDQRRQPVSLSGLAGKVVAVNFIYTRCALPQFCLRVTNNFGVLQKRFARELGRDLVMLTVTFDPRQDTPEVLAKYAARWKADPATWRFLTGEPAEVRRLCALFGVDAFPEEGLINHSLRTAIVDRRGVLAASIEGNQYTPEQLGDLVQNALKN